jgi:hypothetical protein
MKVVRLSAPLTGRLYPQEIFLVLIFTRGGVDLRAMVRSEGNMSLKNPVTPPGIIPGPSDWWRSALTTTPLQDLQYYYTKKKYNSFIDYKILINVTFLL